MAANTRLWLFVIALLICEPITIEVPHQVVIWNVGQGQWVTVIDEQGCWHLDMGGEHAPWLLVQILCRGQHNRISLSHWDMDHIGFARHARRFLSSACLLNAPVGETSARKQNWLRTLPPCPESSPMEQWSNPNGTTANDRSWVVQWDGILAPGDSPRRQERHWLSHFKNLSSVYILVLGHHGSRTSTSPALLRNLIHLKMAIASARHHRYGHPHPEVVQELEQHKIPLLRTEDWGNIHIAL